MARPLRNEQAGGWYHVTARGNERKAIYRNDRDRQHFCDRLAEMTDRFRIRLHAFVLMKNHYHLLLELREANLSRALQWLNVSYSVWFNRRHRRSGHLLQGRFKSVVVSRDEWALDLSRYIHLNPVRIGRLGLSKSERQRNRAGLGPAPNVATVRERMAVLRGYRWSSYRAYLGIAAKPPWLECDEILGQEGGSKADQRRRYREYVEAAAREGLEKSPWEEVQEQMVLGSQEFLTRLLGRKASTRRDSKAGRPDLASVIACVEEVKAEKWEEFRERHGDEGRDLVLYLGRRECGLTLNALAKAAGMGGDASVAVALKRFEDRLMHDRAKQKHLERARQLLSC
ncbi:MAG: transposase [Verrucomicrobia bacterium]|nr:transposase [Verrucomicrobiota bacterium]